MMEMMDDNGLLSDDEVDEVAREVHAQVQQGTGHDRGSRGTLGVDSGREVRHVWGSLDVDGPPLPPAESGRSQVGGGPPTSTRVSDLPLLSTLAPLSKATSREGWLRLRAPSPLRPRLSPA